MCTLSPTWPHYNFSNSLDTQILNHILDSTFKNWIVPKLPELFLKATYSHRTERPFGNVIGNVAVK